MNRNLRILGIGAGIRTLGAALYNPFLALFLVNVLHVSYLEVGGIFAGVGAALLPFNLLGGMLTDRVGRRPMLLFGLAGEAAATAGLAYAFSLESLPLAVVAALAGGFCATLGGPATSAYIADLAEASDRTRAFTFYRIGFNAGFSVGVALGGVLIVVLGFAGAVAVATAIMSSGAIFLAATLDASPRDVARRSGRGPGPPGTGESARPRGPTMRESFRTLARDRAALELLLAVAFAALVVGQWSVTFPLYVHDVLGISYYLLGAGLALNGLVVVFGQSFTTGRAIGHRHTSLAILGVGLYAVAFLGLAAAGLVDFAPIAVFFVAVVVLTFGENLLTIPQSTLPSNLAPPDEIGSYNGAFAMVGGLGGLASVLLGGLVLELTTNPLVIWALLLVPAVPAVLLFRHAAGRIPATKDRA